MDSFFLKKSKTRNWFGHCQIATRQFVIDQGVSIVQAFLKQENVVVLSHPPYSPDLVPCDFFLFQRLKISFCGGGRGNYTALQYSCVFIVHIEKTMRTPSKIGLENLNFAYLLEVNTSSGLNKIFIEIYQEYIFMTFDAFIFKRSSYTVLSTRTSFLYLNSVRSPKRSVG